ncbi:MAG: ABC transporter ATP-binding protein/permease [Actinomycetota bacterium]|nr:ABC transporter ATP-binding protein/permease [Actinomycetota bacterium]
MTLTPTTPLPTGPAIPAPTRRQPLRRFLRPYRGSLSLASGLILVETLLDLARPWPLKLAVDNAIGGQPVGGPLGVLDQLSPAGLAAVAAGAGIGLVGIGALVGYLITYLTSATAERVGADLRESVFGRLLGLGLPFHDRHRSGDLVTRLTGDVARVEDSMVAWFTVLVPEVLTLAGMVVVVLAIDLTLGLAALAVVPPLALVVALRRRRIRVAQRASRDADAALASEATEVLRNVRVVQAFTREGEAGGQFSGRSRSAVRAALGAMDLEARWSPVADLLLAAGGGLVLWLGVTAVTSGRMTLGTLLVVLAYLSSLYGPIRALARLARTLARGAASRERILEVLDSGEVVPEAAEPLQAGPPRQGLALRGVWFAYAEGAPVLRHLDLEVAAGERVCVVGPTGAGKSTLLALLLRFYDPDAGAVELDGTDLRDLDLASLRRQLALVPQDPWMLDGTVADNVRFGSSWGGSGGRTPPRMDQASPQDERLEAVAAQIGLDEMIERLPDGWDTQIGEGGVRLSGGQRRRVALARAILRDASVLLLDEPTSGLDAASEQAVLDALDRAAEGRTVLSVSHHLSLAARADRVVVLDGGRVVEQGPPGELLAAGGAYARLWALQHPMELAMSGNSGEGVSS